MNTSRQRGVVKGETVCFRTEPEQANDLRLLAAAQNISTSDLMRDLLSAHISLTKTELGDEGYRDLLSAGAEAIRQGQEAKNARMLNASSISAPQPDISIS